MCRNIRPLFHFEPPATEDEIQAAALQDIRKVAGQTKPARDNEVAFMEAVDAVARATRVLVRERLIARGQPRTREAEREAAIARGRRRDEQLRRRLLNPGR